MTDDICGVTTVGGSGIEWICIRPVHAQVYVRRKSSRFHARGDLIYNNNPVADQHYMVPRWPNRTDKKKIM